MFSKLRIDESIKKLSDLLNNFLLLTCFTCIIKHYNDNIIFVIKLQKLVAI
jgi:hypothetical protein